MGKRLYRERPRWWWPTSQMQIQMCIWRSAHAWGRGVNTVGLWPDGDELKIDVRTQRCLVFRSIRHLEELLMSELKSLKAAGH